MALLDSLILVAFLRAIFKDDIACYVKSIAIARQRLPLYHGGRMMSLYIMPAIIGHRRVLKFQRRRR